MFDPFVERPRDGGLVVTGALSDPEPETPIRVCVLAFDNSH